MLTSLELTNYRGFKSYKMKGLSRVNLLVGKNNSGKTAILEGIQFLVTRGDSGVLAEVAERRGEQIFSRSEVHPSISVDIAHLFHGHALTSESSFSVAGDNGYSPVTVKVVPRGNGKETAEQRPDRSDSGWFLRISRPPRPDKDEPRFRISRDGGVDMEAPIRFRRPAVRRTSGPQARFVGPDSLGTIELAMMWDEVTVAGQETDVAEAMRILDPDLESVHFLTGMLASGFFASRAGIVVGTKGQEGRVPLGSMGDGMRRMMALATALAFTKQGCLFVDEIDTGLHYSVMEDVWKLVIAKAIKSDTQVFTTTHSWDCIEAISRLCQRYPSMMREVSIHRIDRALQHSVPFSGESIVRMAKADIDPR